MICTEHTPQVAVLMYLLPIPEAYMYRLCVFVTFNFACAFYVAIVVQKQ